MQIVQVSDDSCVMFIPNYEMSENELTIEDITVPEKEMCDKARILFNTFINVCSEKLNADSGYITVTTDEYDNVSIIFSLEDISEGYEGPIRNYTGNTRKNCEIGDIYHILKSKNIISVINGCKGIDLNETFSALYKDSTGAYILAFKTNDIQRAKKATLRLVEFVTDGNLISTHNPDYFKGMQTIIESDAISKLKQCY